MSNAPLVLGDEDEEGGGDDLDGWLHEFLSEWHSPEPDVAAAVQPRNANVANLRGISLARIWDAALQPEGSLQETAYHPPAALTPKSSAAMQGAAAARVSFHRAVGSSSSCSGSPLHTAGSGSPLTCFTPPVVGEQVMRCCGLYMCKMTRCCNMS